jgi:hypothetical protein
VGRGADLLLYVLAVTVMLISVILFRRLAELERKYVALARALALREAHDSELRGSTSDGQRAGD